MNQYLKVLGLTLVASLAMTGVMASAAAAAPEFTAPDAGAEDTVTIQADQKSNHVFTASGGTVSCQNAAFHGEQTGPTATEVTITPTYSSCTAFGFSATVSMNGCKYVMHADGTVDVTCSGSNEITITAAFNQCVVHIPAQKGLGTITYTTGTANGKHDLTADIKIEKITGNTTNLGFPCPASSGHFSNGTLTGESTVTGSISGAPTDITHHS